MILDEADLAEALELLRREGGDCLNLEAKSFTQYSAKALGPSLSAFANLPGGGSIILGVAEHPIRVIGVEDPKALKAAAASQSRQAFSEPLTVDIRTLTAEGKNVVVLNVYELPDNAKPCRWKGSGQAYMRQYDGDYAMSAQEEQQLLLRHTRPRNDNVAVPGTSRDDLDPEIVNRLVRHTRAGSTALRNASTEAILEALNVVAPDGLLTVAGLYALGIYPQQFLPSACINAAVIREGGEQRASDRLSITGPVPTMLDEAVAWVERVTSTRIVFGADGHGHNDTEFPQVAVRELIANALIHRDLSEPALTKSVELRLTPDRLIIANPGGLWGLSVGQLGSGDGKSAVNEYLYSIATFLTDPEGRRVIEGLGTGVRAAREALDSAGLPAPHFQDRGVHFSAVLERGHRTTPTGAPMPDSQGHSTATPSSTANGRRKATANLIQAPHSEEVLEAIEGGASTRSGIITKTGLSLRQVGYTLDRLVESGILQMAPGAGRRPAVYAIV